MQKSGFFNSILDQEGNPDRSYLAEDFARYFSSFIGNGVFPNPSTNLQVLANGDMTVTILPGKAWINGYYYENTDDYILKLEPADGVLNRIDRIVLRLDFQDREIRAYVKQGNYASNAIAKELQRDADAYEIALADIKVNAGAIKITQADVTDLRLNNELCGIVHGTVDQVDTTTLFNQYLSWYQEQQNKYEADLVSWTSDKKNQYNNWYDDTTTNAETDIENIKQQFQDDINLFLDEWQQWFVTTTGAKEQEFNTWFEAIKGQLDDDLGAKLSSQIVELQNEKANKTEFDALKGNFDEHKADKIYQGEVHGMKFVNEKLQVFNGKEWIELKGGGKPVSITKNISVKEDDRQVLLNWTDPDDVVVDGNVIAKWKSTNIVRKEGSPPLNEEDGVLVAKSGVRNQYETTPFIDRGVQNNIEYFYGIFPESEDEIVTVSEKEIVSVTPTEQKIYGVEIDENNSNPETSVVYTDDAVGFTPARGNNGNFSWGSWENIIKEEFKIRPCVLKNPSGEVAYYLDYDNFTKKADGTTANLTGADGDVMIEFGVPLWWKFTRINNKLKIQLSSRPFDGAVKHAFEIEDGYNLVPFYPLTLTQILYLLIFKNLDSQTALGRGYVGTGSYSNTGVTNNRTFNYGETSDTANMKFLGMEDYWGNRRWWIDGCFYDNNRNMLIGKGNFNDTGNGYENFGQAAPSDLGGYIDKVQGDNNTGLIPASTGGSATTYYCDSGLVYAGRLPYFGGDRSSTSHAGTFSLNSDTASHSSAYIGGRLFCSRNGKIYIGAYFGVEQNGKLRSISGKESANNKTIGSFRNLARANN